MVSVEMLYLQRGLLSPVSGGNKEILLTDFGYRVVRHMQHHNISFVVAQGALYCTMSVGIVVQL